MAHNRKENAMSHLDIIRAWKDEEYRLSLSTAERAQLPDNQAGLIELTDAQLGAVAGGFFGRKDTYFECTTNIPRSKSKNTMMCGWYTRILVMQTRLGSQRILLTQSAVGWFSRRAAPLLENGIEQKEGCQS